MITSKVYNIKNLKEINTFLKKELKYEFKDLSLLLQSLTHSSLKNELNFKSYEDNEKLEFIGDAVLDLIVSNFLLSFLEYSDSEGSLTINRAKLVNEKALSIYAKSIKLNKLILVSNSGRKMAINDNASVLADSFEALIGAIYLDSDYDTIEEVIINKFKNDFMEILTKSGINYKGLLNEFSLRKKLSFPKYKIVDIKGPDHDRSFKVMLSLDGKVLSQGCGSSIKEAEQEAAKSAIEILGDIYED